jgi:hypothetical protein
MRVMENLMPRFYFHLASKDSHILDDSGKELASHLSHSGRLGARSIPLAIGVSAQQMRAVIESLPYENSKLSAVAVASLSGNAFRQCWCQASKSITALAMLNAASTAKKYSCSL